MSEPFSDKRATTMRRKSFTTGSFKVVGSHPAKSGDFTWCFMHITRWRGCNNMVPGKMSDVRRCRSQFLRARI